jgi:hypothetical protein
MNSYFKEIYERSSYLRPTPSYSKYPPYIDEKEYMEEYFLNYYLTNNIESDRILIPVLWTNCYLNFTSGIQEFLNILDPSKKFFTVSQHDDAILQKLPPDTKTFSAGGNNGQIPIPLICSRIPNIPEPKDRDIFCSFVGSNTHPIRSMMCNAVSNDSRFKIYSKGWTSSVSENDFNNFIDITSRSTFALCPRGYGRTSYRLYEVMQLGAIPVYVYDTPWLPFTSHLNWSEFCVLIGPQDIQNIPAILSSISEEKIKQMQEKMIQVYENNFTLESMCKNIIKLI